MFTRGSWEGGLLILLVIGFLHQLHFDTSTCLNVYSGLFLHLFAQHRHTLASLTKHTYQLPCSTLLYSTSTSTSTYLCLYLYLFYPHLYSTSTLPYLYLTYRTNRPDLSQCVARVIISHNLPTYIPTYLPYDLPNLITGYQLPPLQPHH